MSQEDQNLMIEKLHTDMYNILNDIWYKDYSVALNYNDQYVNILTKYNSIMVQNQVKLYYYYLNYINKLNYNLLSLYYQHKHEENNFINEKPINKCINILIDWLDKLDKSLRDEIYKNINDNYNNVLPITDLKKLNESFNTLKSLKTFQEIETYIHYIKLYFEYNEYIKYEERKSFTLLVNYCTELFKLFTKCKEYIEEIPEVNKEENIIIPYIIHTLEDDNDDDISEFDFD